MKGALIYDEQGAARNRWFISSLQGEAAALGAQLQLVILKDGRLTEFPQCDFALVRAVAPAVNERLQSAGVPTFNNAYTAAVANDKWRTYELCRALDIPVLPTRLIKRGACADIRTPSVVKSRAGHGGSEVFLVRDDGELRAAEGGLSGDSFVLQPLCSQPGIDMRVYCLGGDILAGVLRASQSDFRSNYSLGGSCAPAEVSSEQRRVVRELYGRLGWAFVGVDFIRHNGEWVLNEVEDAVGTRMLYALTDIPVTRRYLQYVLAQL